MITEEFYTLNALKNIATNKIDHIRKLDCKGIQYSGGVPSCKLLNKERSHEEMELKNKRISRSNSIFFSACENGNISDIRKYLNLSLSKRSDIVQLDILDESNGATPAFYLAQGGHAEGLRLIIQHNFDIEAPLPDGASPIFVAAQNGHVECVKLLISAGANLAQVRKDGTGIVLTATKFNRMDILQLVLEAGAPCNIPLYKSSINALSIAAQGGNPYAIKLLLKHGANINCVDSEGYSATYVATQEGNIEALKYLISEGADVNKASNRGATPIWKASQRDNGFCIKLLSKANADVNIAKVGGYTPLHIAAFRGNINAVKALIDAGAIIDQKNDSGVTPLYLAASEGHVNVTHTLIRHGATKNPRILAIARRRQWAGCYAILQVRSEVLRPWNPSTHHLFPTIFKKSMIAFLSCVRRFCDVGISIPLDIIRYIIEEFTHCDWFTPLDGRLVCSWSHIVESDVNIRNSMIKSKDKRIVNQTPKQYGENKTRG